MKGQFEEAFVRFPHISEHIFEFLDVQSLSKCQEVSQYWQKFILETKPFSRQLENYTNIRRSKLKKSLKDYDFQTIQKLAYCASSSHKKAVEACIPNKPPPREPKSYTLFYYILSKEKLNETQFLLVKLILLNKMKKSTAMTRKIDNQETKNFRCTLMELMDDARKGKFGEGYTYFKHMVIENDHNEYWGFLWGWIPILHVAVAQNHLAICKLIFEQIQDIPLLHEWGKLMLHFATLFGHIDMVKFFIDEIPGINPLTLLNGKGENLIEMAEHMDYKDICIFFESVIKKQK